MTTDRLFVILLVMLIPMTGCFGAIDNADAEDNDDETTIVNNYYYNNTTTMMMEQIEYFSNGGVIDSSTPYGEIYNLYNPSFPLNTAPEQYFYPYNFTTNAGEAIKIHYFYGSGYSNMYFDTECSDGTSYSYGDSGVNSNNYLGGSHTDCEHSVTIRVSDSNFDQGNTTATTIDYDGVSFSMIYSIQSVTVV
jgi:hypothetical protein